MEFKVRLSTIFECSLERAFKSPMLCDVTKVHTGFGLMPRLTHVSDDEGWGRPGSTKKVYAAPSLTQRGGFASVDKVLERVENKYWKIEVYDFQAWLLGFYKFTGEWETIEERPGSIRINYTYTLHTHTGWFYPLNWLFAKIFWKRYMRQVLENVRKLAYAEAPYLYP
ncbi:MAG: hypothetical protein K1X47_12065 [Cyclobacteriaceae bacterium]|nr:hypothetical protein [Cyclobacteriaceae bacterium]